MPASKVTVIYNAIDDLFFEEPPEEEIVRVRERYQLHDRFVMYGGNVSPHKNVERLIEAFVLLRRDGLDDLKLLVTGGEVSRYSSLRRAVHRHNLHQHVRFLGYQSETTLAALYRLADVFVFSFGCTRGSACRRWKPWPAARRSSCPTVSSLPEVVGDGAVLVNPYEPRAIADGIHKALGDAALPRAVAGPRPGPRRGRFRGPQSVKRIHAIYQQIAAGRA